MTSTLSLATLFSQMKGRKSHKKKLESMSKKRLRDRRRKRRHKKAHKVIVKEEAFKEIVPRKAVSKNGRRQESDEKGAEKD